MPNSVWHQCLDVLRDEFPAQQFNTWLRPLQSDHRDGQLVLFAPNRFVMDWVNEKYLRRIEEVLKDLNGGQAPRVNMKVGSAPREEAPVSRSRDPRPSTGSLRDETGGQVTEEEKGVAATVAGNSTVRPKSGGDRREVQVEGDIKHQSFLNEGFTFETFVEGKSNQLARAASMQVAENPGGAYNPLFLYGGVGLGKTHLMHAIGNEIVRRNPRAKVAYLRSERFVADMVKALQLNAINEFKRYYRSVDALLIDDIQFFARKERSQEEFFHTFNALLEGGQQVIVTCDRFPKEISDMEERLKSRFGWGLTVMVEPPELETRVAILIGKAIQSQVELPNEVAFFMAKRIRSNIRELEGALRRVIAHARFTNQAISMDLAREALKDLLALQDKLVTVENIQKTVAEYYKIRVHDLLSARRSRSITRPRQVAMALAKELTNHSLPEIGDAFGGRDHTTVLHACRTIRSLCEKDIRIKQDWEQLIRILTG